MKIISLEYKDTFTNWTLSKTTFNDLTLFVGASGVGKSKILEALYNLKNLAKGGERDYPSFNWKLEFSEDGNNYIWQGKLSPSSIFEEGLVCNAKVLIHRKDGKIEYESEEIPFKLTDTESVIRLLSNNKDITPVYNALLKIEYSIQSYGQSEDFFFKTVQFEEDNIIRDYSTLNSILASNFQLDQKLVMVNLVEPQIFRKIEEHFMNVFPQIEKLSIEDKWRGLDTFYQLNIKEKNVLYPTAMHDLSSGMKKVLIHICELYLAPEGSVILIDEFENSLGINCIDEISDEIVNSERNLQFIITSHHPYIINKIPFKNWKIVTREGGVVKTHDAEEFKLGHSKHEAFTQLLNLKAFRTGIVE